MIILPMIQGSNERFRLYGIFKEKAIKLRSGGLSYNDILKKVPVAKSTISLWCRYVKLSLEQNKKLKTQSRKGGLEGIKAIQTMFWGKRCKAFMEGIELSHELATRNPEFVAGLMLYWAEGTKKSSTAITNSDPRIIKFMVKWLNKFFNIKPKQLSIGIHIHPEQDEGRIKNYWFKVTNIPLDNFRKSFIKARGSGYRKNILENGVAKIIVRMDGSTYLLFKLLGAINGFLNLAIDEPIKPKNWMSILPYAEGYKIKNFNKRL